MQLLQEEKIEILASPPNTYQTFCLTDDEKILYYVKGKEIQALDMKTKKIISQISYPEDLIFQSTSLMSISFDNQFCCTSAQLEQEKGFYQLCRFNLNDNSFLDSLENFHSKAIYHLSFMPNTHIVISIGGGQHIKFLDFKSREIIFTLNSEQIIRSMDFILNNRKQILIDCQGQVQLMEYHTSRLRRLFKMRKGFAYKTKLVAEGQIIILQTIMRQFMLSIQNGKLIRKFVPNFDSNGSLIADTRIYYLKCKTIRVIEIKTGELKEFPTDQPSGYCKPVLSKISESILVGTKNRIYIIPSLLGLRND